MNGEEKQFFTALFAEHAEKLGELRSAQKEMNEDLKEVKCEVKDLQRKFEGACVERKEVARAINFALTKHYNEEHDPDKIIGRVINDNKGKLKKIVLLTIAAVLSALGLGGFAGVI